MHFSNNLKTIRREGENRILEIPEDLSPVVSDLVQHAPVRDPLNGLRYYMLCVCSC